MNAQAIRSVFLKSFIGFLSLTALIGIVSLLQGDFGDVQLKVLATTFTISAASVCAMACAAHLAKRKNPMGWLGIVINFLAAALLIIGIWAEADSEEFWKLTLTAIVVGLGFAHALLLQLPDLGDEMDFAQPVAAAMVGFLALMLLALIWGEIDNTGYFQMLGVVSILVVLITLVIPILAKLHKPAHHAKASIEALPGQLVLTPIDDKYYRDAQGAVYRVEKTPGKEA